MAASQSNVLLSVNLHPSSSPSSPFLAPSLPLLGRNLASRNGALSRRHVSVPRRFSCSASASPMTTSESSLSKAQTDLASFLRDVAAVEPPSVLPILLSVLRAQGFDLSDPSERQGIIPLLVPIARHPQLGRRVALLRWPTAPDGLELPLVSIEPNSTIQLLGRSCVEYINRALAEEDAAAPAEAGDTKPLAEAVASAGASLDDAATAWLYKAGDFAALGLARVDVFLLKKVGPFPDVMEQLALAHLGKGDEVSALVTGEYYATLKHFPGFGRPFIFNAELLKKVGRDTEARDSARVALRSPWWTLGVPYQEAADLAGYGNTLLEYAQERISEEGRKADIQKGKSPGQVSLDQSAFLLDVATSDNSWDAIREQLAVLYEEGGLPEVAKFVRSA